MQGQGHSRSPRSPKVKVFLKTNTPKYGQYLAKVASPYINFDISAPRTPKSAHGTKESLLNGEKMNLLVTDFRKPNFWFPKKGIQAIFSKTV